MNAASPQAEPRFAFGANWSSYAATIGQAQIAEAERGLGALVEPAAIQGKRFLDIGCGSGLHALAALRHGAASVLALDYDPNSVATTSAVLQRHAPPGAAYEVRQGDVLALSPADIGAFDIVYSWGVLHHTGRMVEAMRRAAAVVAPGGLLAIALYRKTYMCGFWTWEKRLYCRASPGVQRAIEAIYVMLYRLQLLLRGGDFQRFCAEYKSNRGMDFYHDVRDWLGGYPYESIAPAEVDALLQPLGFAPVRRVVHEKHLGLFGSGCDEYVFRKS